ncbi:hypothetical protein ACFLXA_02860 [Chloroflexota bacterium]
MTEIEELDEIKKSLIKIERVTDRLYNSDDGHTGDIPDIIEHLSRVNGRLDDHDKRINRAYICIAVIVTAIGGSYGITTLI